MPQRLKLLAPRPPLPPQAGSKPQTSLRPRDTNAPANAAAARARPSSTKPAAVSLSSLLQSRSDAASVSRPARRAASPLPDIDSSDRNDPLAATDYVHNIHNYYRRVEPKYRVDPAYMAGQVGAGNACAAPHWRLLQHPYMLVIVQAEINEKMRAILVDWLVEVHLKFKVRHRAAAGACACLCCIAWHSHAFGLMFGGAQWQQHQQGGAAGLASKRRELPCCPEEFACA